MRPVVVEAVDIKRSGEDVFGYRTRVRNEVALSFIKATHTLAWLSIESDIAYVPMRVPPSAPTAARPWRARS
jgi:hypothetical protein